jgi:hypothetical protein
MFLTAYSMYALSGGMAGNTVPLIIGFMCGRARLSSDVSEIKLVFSIPPSRPSPNFAASWNVAPTDPLPVVRFDAKDHQRSRPAQRIAAAGDTLCRHPGSGGIKDQCRKPKSHKRCSCSI